ncbi:MAG TPA: type II toxin-antitoxin system RelE/ParE family toxin [Rhizomicrobium sp.]|nr:type II toxin-antitoxin system RelE/ParE family toxin [Rhizomicrobium sp.]
MPRLAVSEQAEDDLHAITACMAEQDGKLRARKATARLLKAMDNLAFMPGIGSRRYYLDTASRAFPVPPWLIVYELLPEGDCVRVLRIIDGRRDIAYLFGDE